MQKDSLEGDKDPKSLSTEAQARLVSSLQGSNYQHYTGISSELFDQSRSQPGMQNTGSSQSPLAQNVSQTRILDKLTSDGSKLPNAFQHDQYALSYERETRWNEVRKYSDFIRRFVGEASHLDITKENYQDLYTLAIYLLKSVDSLDPDKLKRTGQEDIVPAPGQLVLNPNLGGAIDFNDFLQKPRGLDLLYNRSPLEAAIFNRVGGGESPLFYSNPVSIDSPKASKNYSGEVFFDDVGGQDDSGRRKQRRRRRTPYSTRRNLHCHMCGVTETPEWRKGPAGDHTLCNACGLHYAKSLKKQRTKEDDKQSPV